jgi:hypothetical protein
MKLGKKRAFFTLGLVPIFGYQGMNKTAPVASLRHPPITHKTSDCLSTEENELDDNYSINYVDWLIIRPLYCTCCLTSRHFQQIKHWFPVSCVQFFACIIKTNSNQVMKVKMFDFYLGAEFGADIAEYRHQSQCEKGSFFPQFHAGKFPIAW